MGTVPVMSWVAWVLGVVLVFAGLVVAGDLANSGGIVGMLLVALGLVRYARQLVERSS